MANDAPYGISGSILFQVYDEVTTTGLITPDYIDFTGLSGINNATSSEIDQRYTLEQLLQQSAITGVALSLEMDEFVLARLSDVAKEWWDFMTDYSNPEILQFLNTITLKVTTFPTTPSERIVYFGGVLDIQSAGGGAGGAANLGGFNFLVNVPQSTIDPRV